MISSIAKSQEERQFALLFLPVKTLCYNLNTCVERVELTVINAVVHLVLTTVIKITVLSSLALQVVSVRVVVVKLNLTTIVII